MSDPSTTPVEIRAPRGGRILEIDWADGHRGVLPHGILRGFCPCAHCQGHHGPIRFVEGGDLELLDLEEVGGYAIRVVWGDKHDTGIYTFAFLRALCACDACRGNDGLEARTFAR